MNHQQFKAAMDADLKMIAEGKTPHGMKTAVSRVSAIRPKLEADAPTL